MVKLRMALAGMLLLSLIFLGCLSSETGEDVGNGIKATLYKSPSCGCCGQYGTYLQSKGFDVEVVDMADITSIKQQYGVPNAMQSCHTTVIEGYFVEGHVPVEAINKMLSEMPPIDGIALPGMPSGAPGMPGSKLQPFTVYSVKDERTSEFLMVN